MKFYYRDSELKELEVLHKQSQQGAVLSVLMGRRRIGKTALALEFAQNKPHLYLFVSKKSEVLLCEDFQQEIERVLKVTVHGKLETFPQVFAYLMEYTKTRPLTLIVDEFQEFFSINPSIYSDIQRTWDLNKSTSQMHAMFIGSVYSLMVKIFQNSKEPLFGRADRIIHLKPFTINQLWNILKDYDIKELEALFDLYTLTGGSPKYVDTLLTAGCQNLDGMLNFMIKENSPFLNEGKNHLIEEFGKQYGTYFSILELISRGKTHSSEIESILQKGISGYLDKLENTYHIIQSIQPIDAKPGSKLKRYDIRDNFLKFWFRFIHRNQEAIELGNYPYLKSLILRDYNSYSGKILERFFQDLMTQTQQFNRMGPYWERGYKNEIDIVAVNDMDKIIQLAEIKRNHEKNSVGRLQYRAEKLLKQYHNYKATYLTLSLEDARRYLE